MHKASEVTNVYTHVFTNILSTIYPLGKVIGIAILLDGSKILYRNIVSACTESTVTDFFGNFV